MELNSEALERLSRRINTKHENYQAWQAGLYGNKFDAWPTVEAWRADGCPAYKGLIVLRYLGNKPGGPCLYDVPVERVDEYMTTLDKAGWDLSRVMVNYSTPDESLVLQGEVWTGGEHPWTFIGSVMKKKMRIAVREQPMRMEGLAARHLIRGAMTPGSWQDFLELFHRYDDHVMEFSVWSCCIGNTSGRNTVVWEVRAY